MNVQATVDSDGKEQNTTVEDKQNSEEEKLGGPQFVPKLYLQRYYYVQQTLTKLKVEKIVDFGSAECKIARFLSQIPTAVQVSLVDIDRNILEMSKWCIRPMICDFIIRREKPLTVRMYEGSVTDFDSRLGDCDTVSMVEIIEHLVPDVLDAAVMNVFGKLQPKFVIMTTPNADFNVLFPDFSGFRHWDHKFEWTRDEFQSWCAETASSYGYTVEYDCIGEPPEDFKHVGGCSQAAIFSRTSNTKVSRDIPVPDAQYTTIAESSYPYKDTEDIGDPILNEIDFQLRQFQTDSRYEDCDSNCVVPVETLLRFKQIQAHFTTDTLRDYLRNHGYRLSDDAVNIILPAIDRFSGSNSDFVDDNILKDSQSIEEKVYDSYDKLNVANTEDDAEFWD